MGVLTCQRNRGQRQRSHCRRGSGRAAQQRRQGLRRLHRSKDAAKTVRGIAAVPACGIGVGTAKSLWAWLCGDGDDCQRLEQVACPKAVRRSQHCMSRFARVGRGWREQTLMRGSSLVCHVSSVRPVSVE